MYTEVCREKNLILEEITLSTCISVTLRGTQHQFSENICSDDGLRSKIFGTFVACLPLQGFFERQKNGIIAHF